MAREKKLRNRKPLPEDVLEGRVKVDALELYRLIHRVNPTNRVLSRREAARRYEVKHRLQSFLVLRYSTPSSSRRVLVQGSSLKTLRPS